MSNSDTHLRSLLSPSRSGTFFAPFRSRSANPDGFDSKMKLWIQAIEEWTVINRKLIISVTDIHQRFVSDAGIRPDKECVRLVMSEMKRRTRAVPLTALKKSRLWSSPSHSSAHIHPIIDSYIDPKGWLGWGVKNFVYNPASWAVSALMNNDDQCYSDLTDMSISDGMKFVCQKSLHELSQRLLDELIRISKAEKQACFEWQHLLELITPIVHTIIDATDGKELLELLDLLVEYLASNKRIAVLIDNDTKLVKIANTNDDSNDEDFSITKKDIAMARLLRAKELLTADADKYHDQAQRAKQDAIDCYSRKEIAKAKSLLRSHKRYTNCAEQKESQLTNVEIMLDQLETTNSNMMILQAYKDGADALKVANTNLENNTSILDEVYDVTNETRYLNDEMNQMLNEISRVSRVNDISNTDLEAELNDYIANGDTRTSPKVAVASHNSSIVNISTTEHHNIEDTSLEDLETRLNSLIVCNNPVLSESQVSEPKELNESSTPVKKRPSPTKAPATAT